LVTDVFIFRGEDYAAPVATRCEKNHICLRIFTVFALMNPTSGTANATDFTVQGLTNLASPSTTLDFIPIYDHVAGTIKNVTPGAIAGVNTSGVISIDSATGAFTTSGPNGTETSAGVVQVSAAWRTRPTTQVLTSGTNATYTTPANTR
jgi:hypothetical protein